MVSISNYASSTFSSATVAASTVAANVKASPKTSLLPNTLNPAAIGKQFGSQSIAQAARKPAMNYTQLKELQDTPPLKELDSITKLVARMKNMIFGNPFQEINDGFLHGTRIPGTAGADNIEVRYDAPSGGAFVTFNGVTSFLTADRAKYLQIDGGAGNDTIKVDPNFPYQVNISGGDGNDYIQGGARNDILNGGAGDDVIYGNRGHDTAYGGGGNDQIHLGDDQDYPVVR